MNTKLRVRNLSYEHLASKYGKTQEILEDLFLVVHLPVYTIHQGSRLSQ